MQIGRNSSGATWGLCENGVAWRLTTSTAPTLNAWNHIVIVRSGTGTNQTSIFLNGVRVVNGTVTTSFATGQLFLSYNNNAAAALGGYLSNLRFVPGTAVYDPSLSTLTMPTSPVTAISGTSLLLNATNAGIYDAAIQNDLTTVGDAKVSTAQAKWGGSSMAFDGTGDYLTVPDNPIFTLGSGNWTIEAWVYTGVSSGNQAIIGQCSSSGGGNTGSFVLYASVGGYPRIMVGIGANWQWAQSSTLLPLNQWVHIAGVRNGTTVTIYVNGVASGTYAISTSSVNDSTYSVAVGRTGEYAGEYLNGYISNLRVVNGSAVYTSNFTPPTSPVTAISGTSLLLNATNAGIYDAAVQNDLTTLGNAQV